MTLLVLRLLLASIFRSEPREKLLRKLLHSDDFKSAMARKQMEELISSLPPPAGTFLIHRHGLSHHHVPEDIYNSWTSMLRSHCFRKSLASRQLRESIRSLAGWKYKGLLQGEEWASDHNDPIHDERAIHTILEQYPDLVAKTYAGSISVQPLLLLHLLKARAPCFVIAKEYEMVPEAALSLLSPSLLHFAIRHNNNADVISFLLSKRRNAAFEMDEFGNLPIMKAVAFVSDEDEGWILRYPTRVGHCQSQRGTPT